MAKLSARQALRNLGHRVIELRQAQQMTQEELGELVEWPPRQVQRVEAGEANLSVEKLVALANALHVDLAGLWSQPAQKAVRKPGRPRRSPRS